MQHSLPEARGQAVVPSQHIQGSTHLSRAQTQREQPCPQCGYPMSDLKGGRETLCRNCGFKDSCCY